MVKVLLSAYAAVVVYFLRAYLQRPTVFGVIASLLWPVSLALTLAWLVMLDDDALSL
jgi:p-aminobenzoyl-glutamate transporter AbgT